MISLLIMVPYYTQFFISTFLHCVKETAWAPQYRKGVDKLETVQRRAVKMVRVLGT